MPPLTEVVSIARRFRGPATSANGGYAGGLLARGLGAAAEVTLRQPPPLEEPLSLERYPEGIAVLTAGHGVIAESIPSTFRLSLSPPPPTVDEAAAASRDFVGFREHRFPECFVCGTERTIDDGLRIFPGPVRDQDLVAALWIPAASVADGTGRVPLEIVWAALDCPSGYGLVTPRARRPGLRGAVLTGRIAVTLVCPLVVGTRYLVTGWPVGDDGRKIYAGSAIYSESGEVCAFAKTTWIRVKGSEATSAR